MSDKLDHELVYNYVAAYNGRIGLLYGFAVGCIIPHVAQPWLAGVAFLAGFALTFRFVAFQIWEAPPMPKLQDPAP